MRNESQILKYLNLITDDNVMEISLVYDIQKLFKMDKEKSELMKALSDTRKSSLSENIEENPGIQLI